MARILIIEDNADHRAIFRRLIEHAGHAAISVATASEGLTYTRQQLPDLILLDLRLPDLDGWTVTSTLKSDPRTEHIPVLILTAEPVAQELIATPAFGVDAILLKPFNIGIFLDTIARLLALQPARPDRDPLAIPIQRCVGALPASKRNLPSS
jgi:CheY-like chemotaxis protein